MSEQIRVDSNSIYVIGKDYQLVYVNEAILKKMPEVQTGDYCYRALCHENAPCKNCPLEQEEKSGSIIWNNRLGMWVTGECLRRCRSASVRSAAAAGPR